MHVLLYFSKLLSISAILPCFLHWNGINSVVVSALTAEEDLTFTLQEQIALEEFKPKVIDLLPHNYMKTDIYLIRWLRARKLNVDQAEQMLKSNLEWRRDQHIDAILDEDWSDMLTDFPYWNNTYDKQSRPIGSIDLSHWNFRAIALAGKMPRMLRYMTRLLEEATQAVVTEWENGNTNVTNWKVLIDLSGFSYIRHACPSCIPAWTGFLGVYEEHYPFFADQIININTPTSYQIIYRIIRPLFSPATQQAVKYFGRNKEKWMEYLDNEIDRNQRRVEFGGTIDDSSAVSKNS